MPAPSVESSVSRAVAGLHDLRRLTVVIPTFGRPQYLRRQVSYWKDSSVRVLVLDGSDRANSEIEFPTNFTYLHSREGFLARLISATQVVRTEFVALLADDEFFLKSGLADAVSHLDHNREVIGCVGRCLYFFVDQGRFLVSHAYRDWKPFSTTNDSLATRLDLDLPPNKTHMAMYGVYRTNHWVSMVQGAYSVPFSCGYVYERLLNLHRTVLGRTEILESLLWMRSKENPPIMNSEIARARGSDFVTWATSEEFVSEVSAYHAIAMGLIRSAGVDQAHAVDYVDRFIGGGVLRQQSKEKHAEKSVKRKLSRVLLRYTPKALRLFCKRYLPAKYLRFTGWEGHDLSKIVQDLIVLRTRFNEAELWEIAELSLALYEQRRLEN